MMKTSPSTLYLNLLLRTPTELKFWGDLTSFLQHDVNNYGIGHDGTPKLTTHLHYIGLHMNLHKAQKPIKPKKRGHGGAIRKKKWVHVTPLR